MQLVHFSSALTIIKISDIPIYSGKHHNLWNPKQEFFKEEIIIQIFVCRESINLLKLNYSKGILP